MEVGSWLAMNVANIQLEHQLRVENECYLCRKKKYGMAVYCYRQWRAYVYAYHLLF